MEALTKLLQDSDTSWRAKRRRPVNTVLELSERGAKRIQDEINSRKSALRQWLSTFPADLVTIVMEFNKDICIYWPSIKTNNYIQVRRWHLNGVDDSIIDPIFNPRLVAAANLKGQNTGVASRIYMTNIGFSGGFLLMVGTLCQQRYLLYHFSVEDLQLELIRCTSASPSNPFHSNNRLPMEASFAAVQKGRDADSRRVEFDLYLTGGLNDENWHPSSAVWCCSLTFDHRLSKCLPASENLRWKRLADLPIPLHQHNAIGMDGGLLITGGTSQRYPSQEFMSTQCWYYHHASEQVWRRLPDLPHGRCEHAVAVIDGNILLVGGRHTVADQFAPILQLQKIGNCDLTWRSLTLPTDCRLSYYSFKTHRIQQLNPSSFIFTDGLSSTEFYHSSASYAPRIMFEFHQETFTPLNPKFRSIRNNEKKQKHCVENQ
jgi:hypothetical protein